MFISKYVINGNLNLQFLHSIAVVKFISPHFLQIFLSKKKYFEVKEFRFETLPTEIVATNVWPHNRWRWSSLSIFQFLVLVANCFLNDLVKFNYWIWFDTNTWLTLHHQSGAGIEPCAVNLCLYQALTGYPWGQVTRP